jgi:hypothetical protein
MNCHDSHDSHDSHARKADGKGDITHHTFFYSLQSAEFSPLPSSGGGKSFEVASITRRRLPPSPHRGEGIFSPSPILFNHKKKATARVALCLNCDLCDVLRCFLPNTF